MHPAKARARAETEDAPSAFNRTLIAAIPKLRAYARGMCGRTDHAEDLVQDTLLKALAYQHTFRPGTSLLAWTHVILRNTWRTQLRRARFHGEYDEAEAERILTQPPNQEGPLHLAEAWHVLETLHPERREALLLVGADGHSYEDVAERCGCAVGTIKSRVSRARQALRHALDYIDDTSIPVIVLGEPEHHARRPARAPAARPTA